MAEYQRQNWKNIEDYPSKEAAAAAGIPTTSAESFNHMEDGIYTAQARADEAYARVATGASSPGGVIYTSGSVHTDDYVLDDVWDTGTLERASADAVARGKELVIGWDRTGGGMKHPVLNRAVTLTGAYQAIRCEPGVILKNTKFSAANGAYITIDKGSAPSQKYSGYIKNLSAWGGDRKSDKSTVLRLNRMTNFKVFDFEPNYCDVGLDFRGNCFLAVVNGMRNDFQSLNVPVNIAGTRAGDVAQSGSDINFYDLEINGTVAAVFIDGNQGGFHFHAGQFAAGNDALTVQPSRGVIETGFDYLHPDFVHKGSDIYADPPNTNGYTWAGVRDINFYSPTFEGWWWGDIVYAHEQVSIGFHNPNFNASRGSTQLARGLINVPRAYGNSRVVMTGIKELGGKYKERNLWKVGNNYGGSIFDEGDGWNYKLGDLTIAGQNLGTGFSTPMIYGGFKDGFARSVHGRSYFDLAMGMLKRTEKDTGKTSYYPGWPSMGDASAILSNTGLTDLPDSGQKPLTQAQYDALSTADKNNGLLYFVEKA